MSQARRDPTQDTGGRAIANQIIRSATSVGANYRATCRARSKADFAAKLAIVEEEADESCYWLELLIESKMIPAKRLAPLLDEANQIVAMVTASRKTASRNIRRPRSDGQS